MYIATEVAISSRPLIGSVQSWAAVITLLILAGSIFGASFRNSFTKKTIQSLRDWSKEQDRKIKDQDDRIIDLVSENHSLTAKVQVLQEMVTGKSAVEELTRKFTEVSSNSAARQEELLEQLGDIRKDVREIHANMEKAPTRTTGRAPQRPRSSGSGHTPAS